MAGPPLRNTGDLSWLAAIPDVRPIAIVPSTGDCKLPASGLTARRHFGGRTR
ncbi:hypothetical protein SAMN06272775_1667 [Streptomyces sp. 2323.1]|nr:hypothetical protein SAMN06272775_1667 [Streptomyces sp. 2323.1]